MTFMWRPKMLSHNVWQTEVIGYPAKKNGMARLSNIARSDFNAVFP